MASFHSKEGFHIKKDHRGEKNSIVFLVSKHTPQHNGRAIAVITENENYITVTQCFQIKMLRKINIYGHCHFPQKNTFGYKTTKRS